MSDHSVKNTSWNLRICNGYDYYKFLCFTMYSVDFKLASRQSWKIMYLHSFFISRRKKYTSLTYRISRRSYQGQYRRVYCANIQSHGKYTYLSILFLNKRWRVCGTRVFVFCDPIFSWEISRDRVVTRLFLKFTQRFIK